MLLAVGTVEDDNVIVPAFQRGRTRLALADDLVPERLVERRLEVRHERLVVEGRVTGPLLEDTDVLLRRQLALLEDLDLVLRRGFDVDVFELTAKSFKERVEVGEWSFVIIRRVVRFL